MKRYHVHGQAITTDDADGADITVTVNAESDGDAQRIAWLVCPHLDVEEIEETA